ncbi:peptidase M56 [Phenylobacterium sp. J426]|uniref:M56 family metallopeptidase n=1 Tax=Phenylobacterium sp. J426 TaxID=2898439 RepID=UPI002151B981|nr:M56 family metallopeptidase [Phenylobacterium sp. J426]MCR5874679.1 peptidase M56 [Phenylobacterium sp. J426]
MATDLLEALARANVAGSLVLLLVILVRRPARRLFGPEAAYLLWAAPVGAALLSLAPWPFGTPWPGAEQMTLRPLVEQASDLRIVVALWLAGAAAGLALAWRAQAGFERDAREGRAGPAVSGFLVPRVVMPASDPYSEEERRLIRAHEREHVARGDPKANALAAALQVVFWFNPLIHFGVRRMRVDQELACDAAVLKRFPKSRRVYAEALLKTELARAPLPFGCHWGSIHPLEVRLAALKGGERRDLAGLWTAVAFTLCASTLTWAAKPALPDPPPRGPPADTRPSMSVLLLDIERPAVGR